MGYDSGDNFSFDFLNQMEFHLVIKIYYPDETFPLDFEPNEIPFG